MSPSEVEATLLACADFHAFCRRWQADQWCPLPFADWLREDHAGVGEAAAHLAADAAEWAAMKEARRAGSSCNTLVRRTGPSRSVRGTWSWVRIMTDTQYYAAPTRHTGLEHDSFAGAIAYYLAWFSREMAADYPPKINALA